MTVLGHETHGIFDNFDIVFVVGLNFVLEYCSHAMEYLAFDGISVQIRCRLDIQTK
jgi:hypothetical protein